MLALVIVGLSAVTSSRSIANDGIMMGSVILAICLTIRFQSLRAVQVTLEGYLVHDIEISPYLIVGAEGICGIIAFIFLPIIQHLGDVNSERSSIHEDTSTHS
jgi:hypothetical protein